MQIPLAVCVGSTDKISSFCDVSHLPTELLDSLLPGPVTVVLKRKESVQLSVALNPGLETIGRAYAGF